MTYCQRFKKKKFTNLFFRIKVWESNFKNESSKTAESLIWGRETKIRNGKRALRHSVTGFVGAHQFMQLKSTCDSGMCPTDLPSLNTRQYFCAEWA